MNARQVKIVAIFIVVSGLIVGGFLWSSKAWKKYQAMDNKMLNDHRMRAIKVVLDSRVGSQEMRDQLASDFLEKLVTTQPCQWSGQATWNGSERNPNWFSSTKGSDGMLVTCETSIRDDDGDVDRLTFKWDVLDRRGVVGFHWGYSALQNFE
ncbi:MAG TPA: hypothetical protein VHD85_22245 [Terracidiphilus sp.]|nr:hypothetical protein [Terracidiphilus sp.]